MNETVIRKHYRFTGSVQGVGFRYRAVYAAQMLGISGWVANMWDGSVEMEAQGTALALETMIERIAAGTYVSIEGRSSYEIPVVKGESGFYVRED